MTQNLKPGDVVHVRAEVIEPKSDGGTAVYVQFRAGSAWVTRADIISVEPRPLQVGDRVLPLKYTGQGPATILAIDEDMAWCKWSTGERSQIDLAGIKRVEPSDD